MHYNALIHIFVIRFTKICTIYNKKRKEPIKIGIVELWLLRPTWFFNSTTYIIYTRPI